jgi:hypothetical protein|tara:strand:+ start:326 stop:562 length:237 start_codon:yes stop_codon:yes gene_type:complete
LLIIYTWWVSQKKEGGVTEFFTLLAAHIPCYYERLITYYGDYNSSHNGKLKRENCEDRIEEVLVEAAPVTSDTQKPSS